MVPVPSDLPGTPRDPVGLAHKMGGAIDHACEVNALLRKSRRALQRSRAILVLALAALTAVVAALVVGSVLLHNATVQNCQDINGINRATIQADDARIAAIGVPGTPGYRFYLAHPADLAVAKARIVKQEEPFTPRSCV